MKRKLENLLIGLELTFFMILVSPLHISNPDLRCITYSMGFLLAPYVFFLLMIRIFNKHEQEVHTGHYVASALLTGVVAFFCLGFWACCLFLVRVESTPIFQHKTFPNVTIVLSHLDGGAFDSGDAEYNIERSIAFFPGIKWVTPIDTNTINKENWIRLK
jgi:hypothetical protein